MESNESLLLKAIEKFSEKKILVLGDGIVDEYIYGSHIGSSLDSPNTKKLEHKKTEIFMGGAGNVSENLLALGANITFVTVLGNDSSSEHYKNWSHQNLQPYYLLEEGRKTIVKSRICEEGNKLLELEYLDCRDISKDTEKKIIEIVKKEIWRNDVIIFQDQGHGFFSNSLLENLKSLVKDKKVLVNHQIYLEGQSHLKYSGFHTIFMNLKEAKLIDSNFSPELDGRFLTEKLRSNACVTLGGEGALFFAKGQKYYSRGLDVTPVDSCGAGDSFLSAFAVSDFESHPDLSLQLANAWAGLSVQKRGTEVPNIKELIGLYSN